MIQAPERAPRSARVAGVIDAAHGLLESEGIEALTMRRIGEAVGVRAPSLYKHFPDKRSLIAALVDDALTQMGRTLHQAVDRAAHSATTSTVTAILDAYRRTALNAPNLYRLATGPQLPRELLTPGLEAWSGEPFFLATGEPHMAQALWAAAHGLAILEIEGRFMDDSDLDRTWRSAAAVFAASARIDAPPR